MNSSYWNIWCPPLQVSAGGSHRKHSAKAVQVKEWDGTFSWSAATPEIVVIAACTRNLAIGTTVVSCIETSLPGFVKFLRTQSVQCCPFSWGVSTTQVIEVAACTRNLAIGTAIVSCVDTSLGPLNCLFAAKKGQNAEMKLFFRHVDILPSHGSYWTLSTPRRRRFPGESSDPQYLFSSNAPMKSRLSQLWERPAFMRQDVRFLDG
jgi:hypothetical protein